MFELKQYQEKHVKQLAEKINEFIRMDIPSICILKSPTGSGKTIMVAELLKRIAESQKNVAFIWITVFKLHMQSKEKLEQYYEKTRIIECSYFQNLHDKQIQDNEILFFNWSLINKTNNVFVTENEMEYNLSNVIKNTKEDGKEIILILDESHHTASTERSEKIIEEIDPIITLEVSATPKIKQPDYIERVSLNEVKNEEMLKKTIKLNPDLHEIRDVATDELIITTALKKRDELYEQYRAIESSVNPLVLIQIPNARNGVDMKDPIMKILDNKFNINVERKNLALYFSDKEHKINLEDISQKNNDVKVMIFKQAATTGWDCPRASILILFREWNNYEFSIQTIGRIIRMPELKYYEHDELNSAYIYTNISKVNIAEDMAKDFIITNVSKRTHDFKDLINLKSAYIKRNNEKTRLDGQFHDIFLAIAKKYGLINKINFNIPKLTEELIRNAETQVLDKVGEITGDVLKRTSDEYNIMNRINAFTEEMSNPFAVKRSHAIIRRSIHRFFENESDIRNLDNMNAIVLSPENKQHFIEVIDRSKQQYSKDVVMKLKKTITQIPKWNIPEKIEYTDNYTNKKYKKSIMQPVFVKEGIKNEISFMEFLEQKNNVKWWFKNGESDKKYFAILYVDPSDGEEHSFYVDFVVFMNDGRIGLFETKKGITADIAKPKAEALSTYIKKYKSKKLFGGIVIPDGHIWKYHDGEKYKYIKNDLTDWKILDLT